MLLRVGQSPSALSLARYGKHLDLLEVRLDSGVPRKRTLEAMRSESPEHLVFSVLVPKRVASLEQEPTEADVSGTLDTARALGARFIVVRTPATARPVARTRARLARLVELLEPSGAKLVWEPRGLWAEADAEQQAEALRVTLARDPARDDLPAGDLAYARISSLGTAGRVRTSAIERAADRLAAFSEAYVIIEGDNAVRAAQELRSLLGASAPEGGDDSRLDGDDEDEDEDDFEDEDFDGSEDQDS